MSYFHNAPEGLGPAPAINPTAVQLELDRILRSPAFRKAQRSQRLLRYLVEAAIAEPPILVKEYTIALDVFDRGSGYDPAVDATVRVEAGRLRNRLRECYFDGDSSSDVVIEVPKGRYAAVFLTRPSAKIEAPSPVSIPESTTLPATSATEIDPVGKADVQAATLEVAKKAGERRPIYILASVFLSVAIALIVVLAWRRARLVTPAIHSMAVLPLKNLSGDPDQEYFAVGITDELTTELAKIPGLRLVSFHADRSDNDAHKSAKQLGKQLNVDAVVQGSVERVGDTVRINAELVDTRSERYLWAETFNRRLDEILQVQDDVAEAIAFHAKLLISPSENAASGTTKIKPAAYEAYLRGRYYLDKRDAIRSAAYFAQAIDEQPTYSSAYAGLADALESETTLGIISAETTTPKAIAAAKRAIELDPENGEAYTALGAVAVTETWDWSSAGKNLRRGIELNPSNSFAEMMDGLYFDAVNRPEQAVQHMRRAVAIDPLSFFAARNLGSALYYARRYDEALTQLERSRELEPRRSALVDLWMSRTYEAKGMRDQAVKYDVQYLQQIHPKIGSDHLLTIYRQAGWSAYWRARFIALQAPTMKGCQFYDTGMMQARMGNVNAAFSALQSAVGQRCFWMAQIEVDPLLDGLRADPRFADLAARIYK